MKRELDFHQIQEFSEYLCQEEREKSTREAYLRNVRDFCLWLDGRAVNKDLVIAWKESLQSRYAPATVNAKLAAVNALFKFCGWHDCRVKALRLQRRVFRAADRDLSREEYARLVAAAGARGDERLALLMETICSTGIRVSEVRYITVEACRAGWTEIRLKGKIRTILLPGKLCRKLLKYAKGQKRGSGEIFLTRAGKSMSRCQIWAAMKSLCKAAGVKPSKVFPHNLRHLFATVYYRRCRDIVKLADILGHASIETTRLYLISTGREHAWQLDRLGLVS